MFLLSQDSEKLGHKECGDVMARSGSADVIIVAATHVPTGALA